MTAAMNTMQREERGGLEHVADAFDVVLCSEESKDLHELEAILLRLGIRSFTATDLDQACAIVGAIEPVDRHRQFGQHRAALRRHLGEAAGDEDPLGHLAAVEHRDDAGAQAGDEGRVAGQRAEVALGPRHHHHLDRPRQQQAFRRDELEFDLLGHRGRSLAPAQAASAAIWRAFCTASSMVPTM